MDVQITGTALNPQTFIPSSFAMQFSIAARPHGDVVLTVSAAVHTVPGTASVLDTEVLDARRSLILMPPSASDCTSSHSHSGVGKQWVSAFPRRNGWSWDVHLAAKGCGFSRSTQRIGQIVLLASRSRVSCVVVRSAGERWH